MIIGRDQIIKRLKKPFKDPYSLAITPLVIKEGQINENAIDEDAVDLRLGTNILVSRSDRVIANIPGYSKSDYKRSVHIPLGKYFILPGHQTVLASTLEYIKLPIDFSAMVLTKSSWARNFITVESAPWVHPCYRGCLTLELANVSEVPVLLYPGYPVAQLVFMKGEIDRKKRDKLEGSYVGPIKPESGALKQPKDQLKKLGIFNVKLPWDEWIETKK
jgi:dCTP deaminase